MDETGFECCAGKCCGGNNEIDRRDFMKAAALAAGGLGLMGYSPERAAAAEAAASEALAAWTAQLWERGSRRVYRGAELKHIAMPMGGIGAGQVYITGKGGLDQWQIVNNFNSKAYAPGRILWRLVEA